MFLFVEKYLNVSWYFVWKPSRKNKFRTIQFNLKDTKNDYFWRRVILGEISASTLHKMSPTEMGSKEKMEWRKQQQQNELEQIKKIEEIKQKEVSL